MNDLIKVLTGEKAPRIDTLIIFDEKTTRNLAITIGLTGLLLILLWATARKLTNP
jgi:predicted nucleic acid-binding protein